MRTSWNSKLLTVLIISAMTYSIPLGIAHGQAVPQMGETADPDASSIDDPCEAPSVPAATKQALRLVCLRERVEITNRSMQKAIIVGFLGGFVKRDDVTHPEVLFANYLRGRYGSVAHIEVFGNHDGHKALQDVVQQLDFNHDGLLTAVEKQQAEIILYGHSWGASQAVTFARDLGRDGIPVALTIQIDSVKKIGQDDHTIPANVAKAVNFYQEGGLTPGQPRIVAADAARTKILGNFHMIYRDHRIKCDNYRWLSRHLNRPHHLIENDPLVWDQIASLIESQLSSTNADSRAASHLESSPR